MSKDSRKKGSRLPGIVMFACAVLLFSVGELILGCVFTFLGGYLFVGGSNSKKKVSSKTKSQPAVKGPQNPANQQLPYVNPGNPYQQPVQPTPTPANQYSHKNTGPVAGPFKPNTVPTPVKPNTIPTPVTSNTIPTPVKPDSVTTPVKPSTISTPVKPNYASTAKKRRSGTSSPAPSAPPVNAYTYLGPVDQYFFDLLKGSFEDYDIEKQANPEGLFPPHGSAPSCWTCSCGVSNTGNFCSHCGSPKPVLTGWTCTCGKHNNGKFCANCGKAKSNVQQKTNAAVKPEPISFLLRKGGTARLAVILCPKNSWNTASIRRTMRLCKEAGVPCLRFIEDFRNEAGYVIDRVQENLD